VLKRVELG